MGKSIRQKRVNNNVLISSSEAVILIEPQHDKTNQMTC